MKILRTPDERFDALPDYPFTPHYVELKAHDGQPLRLHYVDEGPREAAPVLLMHGEPSWSYLYRHMISGLAALGHRVLAPDLIGFGRSDKPSEAADHTYERHVGWMLAWLEAVDLRGVTLFCQDWGGLIGLRLVAAQPDRFARVAVANTGLPEGSGLTKGFEQWLAFSQSVEEFPVADVISMGVTTPLSDEIKAAYMAPFPDERYKAAARIFPSLVPVTPSHASVEENKAAWEVLRGFERPWLTLFSDKDPVTRGGERVFQHRVPGAQGQPHVTIEGAGHFLQEDASGELVARLHDFIVGV